MHFLGNDAYVLCWHDYPKFDVWQKSQLSFVTDHDDKCWL